MLTKPSAAVEEEAAQELHGIESPDALTAAVAIRGQFIEPRRGAEIGSRTSAVEHALAVEPAEPIEELFTEHGAHENCRLEDVRNGHS